MAVLADSIDGGVSGPSLISELKIHRAQKQAAAAFADRRTTEMRLAAVEYRLTNLFPQSWAVTSRSLDELPSALQDASSAANGHLKSPVRIRDGCKSRGAPSLGIDSRQPGKSGEEF